MRIGVVTLYYPSPRQAWDGRSAHETMRELGKMADVHVFFPMSHYPVWAQKLMGQKDPDISDFRPSGPPVTYSYYPAVPLLSRHLNGGAIYRAMRDEVRAYRPDILLGYVVYPTGYAAVRMGRDLGVPVVLKATGSDLNRKRGPLVSRQRELALREADCVTTVSADLARTAVRLGADPAHTLPIINGCDTVRFHPQDRNSARQELGLPLDQEIALYVGRYDMAKGLAELIEAAEVLHKRRPQLHTYLVGSGPDQHELEERIQEHRADDYVHLTGSVPSDRVSLWNAACDINTLPSYMEGCPNVVLEALASGRPVVATNVGGIPELVDDSCGRLVPARDPIALANALDEVLTLPWDGEAIASGHSRSWNDVAQDLYVTLEEALERHRQAGRAPKA